jgi:hypothetical protein
LKRVLAVILALAAAAAPGSSFAAAPKDYAYVFVQGRIADPYEKNALAGATVRLTDGDRVFEAVTDRKGVFRFEKLPVSTFTLDIVAADGKRVQWFQQSDFSDPVRPRVKVKFGKRRGASTVTVVAKETEDKIEVIVKSPPARWGRFWKEFAIFGAAAVVLATR